MSKKTAPRKPNPVKRFFSVLRPGLITGAADDDPSGIATYSIVGAQMGTSMLWTAFLTWPFMASVQFMCARIGMVTGLGLGDALRRKGPPWLLFGGALGLLSANTINVGADLTGMADAAAMLTGINSHIYVVLFGIGIGIATIRCRYHQIAMIMKWLALVLFAYVITAFIAGPDWWTVLRELDRKFKSARAFYGVIIISTLLGIGMDFIGVNPVKALFWTAIINGLLAPFLLVGILIAASDRKLMQNQPSSWLSRIVIGIITIVMFGAAAAMFIL